MSMYLRVKRGKQTIFLHCEPTDSILSLKHKIKAITNVAPEDQKLMIIDEKIPCDDAKTVKECKLEDAGSIALLFKVSSDPVEWEEINIAKFDDPEQPPPTAGGEQ
uniref:Ubiquitin-like domain-containing protein n=1 Tax=Hemiselmis andersenii TaxID=464988 RepID=A0A6T8I8S2_HEMAN|mmetsp:Transcript_3076/g.7076  ORF Transcript_3076/g.7076 Transcript_3076/m.7076 type:complete len:106 (+) Transcript_3076:69-386(+)